MIHMFLWGGRTNRPGRRTIEFPVHCDSSPTRALLAEILDELTAPDEIERATTPD